LDHKAALLQPNLHRKDSDLQVHESSIVLPDC
jgi:hypothetical protein